VNCRWSTNRLLGSVVPRYDGGSDGWWRNWLCGGGGGGGW
jgi:hypothetical protein